MCTSRVDEKQSVQLLEDNRLNKANMCELFVSCLYASLLSQCCLFSKFNFTALLIKTSKHKAASACLSHICYTTLQTQTTGAY